MDHNDKIRMVFHRDYYKKKLYRICELMATVHDMVYKLVQMINGYLSPTLGTTINDGTITVLSVPLIIDWSSACKKQGDSKSSREALRLTQLGFLGSCRWDSSTSTQHFEMLDTVDVGRMEILKYRRSTRDRVIQSSIWSHFNSNWWLT